MEVEIVRKHENNLLKRVDVTFKAVHPKEKTPQRTVIRDKIAGIVGKPRDGVIIAYMRSQFGTPTSDGFAKCYDSADDAKKTEPKFLLIRHGLAEKVAKTAAAAPAKAPEKKK
ncbi:MAG TPA: 30S ribosomal protein S24e [Candidatus Thermoplasmatota archaeon]|nr:30S ribosomal protein S24e [Candidatus Thermoplasmatota archaeon]